MRNIDNNDKLKDNPFSYNVTKSAKTIIYYNGKQIKILSEKETKKLLSRLQGKSEFNIQLELAKITGNFKRGNEKLFKKG